MFSKLKILLTLILFIAAPAIYAAVDLNTATEAQIEAVNGVGPKMADAIIKARPFKSIDDLKNVKGIGSGAKFEKMKSAFTVLSATTTTATTPAPATAPTTATAPATAPTTKTMAPSSMKVAKNDLAPGQTININTASASDIEKLPGIGPKKAELIVAARPFEKPEDVMKVKGIKEGIYKKIQPFITVR